MTNQEWDDKGFEHLGKNGNLILMPAKTGPVVYVERRKSCPWKLVLADVAESIAYHALHMFPEIQKRGMGFAGYDTLRYEVR